MGCGVKGVERVEGLGMKRVSVFDVTCDALFLYGCWVGSLACGVLHVRLPASRHGHRICSYFLDIASFALHLLAAVLICLHVGLRVLFGFVLLCMRVHWCMCVCV